MKKLLINIKKLETRIFLYVEGVIFFKEKVGLTLCLYKIKNKKSPIILDSIANLQSVRELIGGYDMGKKGTRGWCFL